MPSHILPIHWVGHCPYIVGIQSDTPVTSRDVHGDASRWWHIVLQMSTHAFLTHSFTSAPLIRISPSCPSSSFGLTFHSLQPSEPLRRILVKSDCSIVVHVLNLILKHGCGVLFLKNQGQFYRVIWCLRNQHARECNIRVQYISGCNSLRYCVGCSCLTLCAACWPSAVFHADAQIIEYKPLQCGDSSSCNFKSRNQLTLSMLICKPLWHSAELSEQHLIAVSPIKWRAHICAQK